MKKTNKIFEPLLVLGGIIASYLVFKAYKSISGRKKEKFKKWINWEIEFNKDASEEERASAVKGIENYILEYSSGVNNSDVLLKNINFSKADRFSGQDRMIFNGEADFWIVATVAFPPPPPRPPHPPVGTFLPPVIINIKDLNLPQGKQQLVN